MSKSVTTSYEVWVERLHGKWTAVSEEGSVRLFGDLKEARRIRDGFLDDGTVIHADVYQRTLVESVNCAGVHAAKMGLNRPNVHIEGIRVGPKAPPEFIAKARDAAAEK